MRLRHKSRWNPALLSQYQVLVDKQLITLYDTILEVGSGRGKMISEMAKDNPLVNYVALEREPIIAHNIVEKRDKMELNNLTIICDDANFVDSYIPAKSVKVLYLTFSDPWPKTKQKKKRLTNPNFLVKYLHILKDDGVLIFKTDQEGFFNDALVDFANYFEIKEISRDWKEELYLTDYEIKFGIINKIHRVVLTKKEL